MIRAGIGKILTTILQGNWNWANATNMQYYLFVAGWARPGYNQSALPRIGWLVQRPWACCLLQVGGLAFQLGCPVALWGGHWSVAVFVVAVQFHIGSFYLLGLDFMSQWAPCLLVFLVDRRPGVFLPEGGWETSLGELCCWSLGAVHLLGQLYCATTLREMRVADDVGGMPFSCMYMYCVNSNIFGSDMISWYTLMTGDQRSSGHLGIMEWSGPIFTSHNMEMEDMMKLPFKAVWFGHSMFKPKFMQHIIKSKFAQQRFHLFANFSVGAELEGALREVCQMLEPQTDERLIHDARALQRLVALQRKASDAFFASVTRDAQAKLLQRGESFLPEDIEHLLKLERASDSGLSFELAPHTAS